MSANKRDYGVATTETPLTLRVSYAETDQMGVVNSVWYLRWFEYGRTEYIRARGKTYKQFEEEGFLLPVAEASIKYHRSARYDEMLTIYSSLIVLSPARLTFTYRIVRDEDGVLLTSGQTTHPVTNREGRPMRIPAELKDLLLSEPK